MAADELCSMSSTSAETEACSGRHSKALLQLAFDLFYAPAYHISAQQLSVCILCLCQHLAQERTALHSAQGFLYGHRGQTLLHKIDTYIPHTYTGDQVWMYHLWETTVPLTSCWFQQTRGGGGRGNGSTTFDLTAFLGLQEKMVLGGAARNRMLIKGGSSFNALVRALKQDVVTGAAPSTTANERLMYEVDKVTPLAKLDLLSPKREHCLLEATKVCHDQP